MNATDIKLTSWELINSKLVLDASPWLTVSKETIRLPNGQIVDDFFTIQKSDYVVLFTLNQRNEVLTLWRYRHGASKVELGLPSGGIEEGESSLDAAKRELLEETGFSAQGWEKLGVYTVDGNQGMGKAHFWLGRELEKVKVADSGDLEEMNIELMKINKLRRHMDSGDISTMAAAFGVILGLNHK